MCDHSKSTYSIKVAADLKPEPKDPGDCHIYYVHQDGAILCEPNVQFNDGQDPNRQVTSLKDADKNEHNPFCGEDRLTLIHLPAKDFKSIMDVDFPEEPQKTEDVETAKYLWPAPNSMPKMPEYFGEKLKNICPHCQCKGNILWRNLHRPEPHFDACFRYLDGRPTESTEPVDKEHHRCFLKLYTLRVPFLASPTAVLSLVHHIRAEGSQFVPARQDTDKDQLNQEHIFGFIAGFASVDLGLLLTDLFTRWQDVARDHLKTTAGMTPRLFMAAVISQYGSIVAQEVIRSGRALVKCDRELQAALSNLDSVAPGSSGDVTVDIRRMNMTLINMNKNLTGTRSTMHYLADSALTLLSGVSTFEEYIKARLSEWVENPDSEALKGALHQLDSCKESMRDRDKLELVRKNMQQYKVDIKALQQHIDINVGMVRNLIAERDRAIQLFIARNTDRDGFNMKIIAVLTALFLPGTFMAIFLTTPMFDFTKTENVIVDLPFKLYWSIAGSVTVLLVVGQLFLANPEWITKTFDSIGWEILKETRLYTASMDRSSEKEKLTAERNSVVRRGTSESQLSEKTQTLEGQSLHNGSILNTTEPGKQIEDRPTSHSRNLWLPFGRRARLPPKGEGHV